jgi:hypothetical protein
MKDAMSVLVEKRPVGNFTFIKTVMYGLMFVCLFVCISHCVTQICVLEVSCGVKSDIITGLLVYNNCSVQVQGCENNDLYSSAFI